MTENSPLIIPGTGPLDGAVKALRGGGVVAYPTETFYGLGCDPFNRAAVQRLFVLKGRERGKPVSVIIPGRASLDRLVTRVPPVAERLIERFWPGPLTIVFEASTELPGPITAGTGCIGVRVSSNATALELTAAFGGPVTATSANPAGEPPASTPGQVLGYFDGRIDALIDGGPLGAAVASTVVDVTGPGIRVIREGAVPAAELTGHGG